MKGLFKYSSIPFSGEELIDNLPDMMDNSSLDVIRVRMVYWHKFQTKCKSISNDNNTTSEQKIIWVRSVINSLDAIYHVADDEDSFGVTNLTAEFIGILEATFMQSPNPICVKRIAMDIGATYYFDQQVAEPENTILEDGHITFENCKMEYQSELELRELMAGTKDYYQKGLCIDCPVKDCKYDCYYRSFMKNGEENEKYHFTNDDKTNTSEESSSAISSLSLYSDTPVTFRQLEGKLADAQVYLEALYPKFVDENFRWKKGVDGVTVYHAYWVAYVISRELDGIIQQDIGNLFGINNLHTKGTDARLKPNYRDTIMSIFRSKGLSVPSVE